MDDKLKYFETIVTEVFAQIFAIVFGDRSIVNHALLRYAREAS